jgi:hypothetical protein
LGFFGHHRERASDAKTTTNDDGRTEGEAADPSIIPARLYYLLLLHQQRA